MFSLNHEGSLWMGDIHDYMDETFIKEAFAAMDETVNMVKHIKNKYTGFNAGYCFVHFKDKQTALRVMHKLNGKIIPNTQPPVRFMLNESNAGKTGSEREHSIWVGDLDKSVDDSLLFKTFASRYSSVISAKVVLDRNTGVSRGYAFIRFGSEEEHKDALTHMNGFNGFNDKKIRVSVAVPRSKLPNSNEGAQSGAGGPGGGDYNSYQYDQYWYNYQAWQQNYGQQNYDGSGVYQGYDQAAQAVPAVNVPPPQGGVAPAAAPAVPVAGASFPAAAPAAAAVPAAPAPAPAPAAQTQAAAVDAGTQDDDDQVVEHDVPADLEGQNHEYVRRNEEFWDALDGSRWLQPDTLNPALELFIKT